MDRREWERIGDSVKDIVETAVNSQDFKRLNQTISTIVEAAVDGINASVKRQTVYSSEEQERRQAVRQEEKERRQNALRMERERAQLFINDRSVWNNGLAMVIPGGIFAGFGLIALVVLTVLGSVGIMNIGISIAVMLLVVFQIPMMGLVIGGSGLMKRANRFRKYVRLSENYYCNIGDMAAYMGQSEAFTRKDIEKMITKGWFKQGHMDDEKKCFIASNKVYQEYLEVKRQRQMLEAGKTKEDKQDSESAKVIQTGQDYIREIRHWNDLIPGEEISRKISRMELLIKRIFERIEEHPEQIEDIRKLLKYYLPTTVKLLKAYDELDRQEIETETIQSSKQEIEKTLDTLNTAFEKMLDGLFQDTAWDVASDISVLHTMLAQEGLTKDDF